MKYEIIWKGEKYEAEWSDDTNFEETGVHSVAGFIFDNNGKICLIRIGKERGWTLVGGRIEKSDKTPEEAFIRETQEEADLELKDIKRLGCWKTFPKGKPDEVLYTGRFVARVKKINPQTIDPAENVIPERIFINPKDFNNYANWGENGEFQLKKALEMLKKGMK